MKNNKEKQEIICIYKPIGFTPLQAIKKFKQKYKIYKKCSISHAGKLDPLAEGILLLIINPDRFILKKLMKLDKEYKAEILIGFSTDSFDIQGIAKKENEIILEEEKLKEIIDSFKGKYEQTIPVFSGKKINGRPLYYYARKNILDKIKIPKKEVKIKEIELINIKKISSEEILKEIIKKIKLLEGDFRQKEIIKNWKKILNEKKEDYYLITVIIKCSSGTYIRSIANDIGKKLNSGAILYNLIRTRLGKYSLKDCKKIS